MPESASQIEDEFSKVMAEHVDLLRKLAFSNKPENMYIRTVVVFHQTTFSRAIARNAAARFASSPVAVV